MDPIIVIEDDLEDQEIIKDTFNALSVENPVVMFDNAADAFEYLSRKEVTPFIILSDINVPIMNGFELRNKIHDDPELRIKCIPYIFLTTGGDNKFVWEAYSRNAQGFFIKPTTFNEWKRLLSNTVDYWKDSKKPQ